MLLESVAVTEGFIREVGGGGLPITLGLQPKQPAERPR